MHVIVARLSLLCVLLGSVVACSAKSAEPVASRSELDAGAPSRPNDRPRPRRDASSPSGASDGGATPSRPSRDAARPRPSPEPDAAGEPEPQSPEPESPEPETVVPEPVEPEPTTDVEFPGEEPPAEWTCSIADYQDSVCNCGCGVPDLGCSSSSDVTECEVCDSAGSCGKLRCPGRIDPSATQLCEPPPEGWTCSASHYHDGVTCHCGCGAPDPDCSSGSVDACHICEATGSCTRAGCPGSIHPDDNSVCAIPEGWECSPVEYADGFCTCGCGVLDADCASLSVHSCEECSSGCSYEACPGTIDTEDNTVCSGVPSNWYCDERFFGDGELCNCGCGAFDPDCESQDVAACDRCDFTGSCSALPCPGIIDPDDNTRCEPPPPPDDWTCDSSFWGDSYCDCGCGAPDVDCPDGDVATCETCAACGSNCQNRVDPADTTQCLPIPEEWTCDTASYFDGFTCHCGCGAVDPDCPSASVEHCVYCGYYQGCSRELDCSDILADDNAHCVGDAPSAWTCESSYYDDDACDCGCGLMDPSCVDATEPACDFCNSPGSCSTTGCPGTINAEDNAVCVE